MVKPISVAQLGHGGASRAIREAQDEPVLVSNENRPAAWIVSSEKLAEYVEARDGNRDAYDRALQLIAVELFDKGALSMGRATKLAGLDYHDFIDLCGRMGVPVLREPPGGIATEVEATDAYLQQSASAS